MVWSERAPNDREGRELNLEVEATGRRVEGNARRTRDMSNRLQKSRWEQERESAARVLVDGHRAQANWSAFVGN